MISISPPESLYIALKQAPPASGEGWKLILKCVGMAPFQDTELHFSLSVVEALAKYVFEVVLAGYRDEGFDFTQLSNPWHWRGVHQKTGEVITLELVRE